MNKEGAVAGMVTGLLTMIFYILKFKFDLLGGGGPEDWWLGISPEGFGFIAMLVNFAVSIAICQATPPPPADVQDLVEDIRYPRGAGEAVAH